MSYKITIADGEVMSVKRIAGARCRYACDGNTYWVAFAANSADAALIAVRRRLAFLRA